MEITLWRGSGDPAVDGAAANEWTDPKLTFIDYMGLDTSPPLVHLGFDRNHWRLCLTRTQVLECVRALVPVLGEQERNLLATYAGTVPAAEAEELLAENVRLAERVAQVEEAFDRPWAEVYDFAKEKARIELEREQAETKTVA